MITKEEKNLLKKLAEQVKEIASLPVQRERVQLIKDLNSLKAERPVVLAEPEGGWVDLVPESRLVCKHNPQREWERELRRSIARFQYIPADNPITDELKVLWIVNVSDLGVKTKFIGRQAFDQRYGSLTWNAPIKKFSDLKKLKFPEIEIDRAKTLKHVDLAKELFGDTLTVVKKFPLWWSYGLTERLIYLRGLEQTMYDMYENPSLLHELMLFLRDEALYELEIYEREGLLTLNNGAADIVTNGRGATDELPADDFSGQVRLKDLWVMAESQEFTGVGPDKFYEFALQYQIPIIKRFGLCAYGCCEPLDYKYDVIIKDIPNLRRISVAPKANRKLAAEKIGDRFIYAWKPDPTTICSPREDLPRAEKMISETLEITRDCHLQIMLADTMTFYGEPERLTRWIQLANKLIAEHYKC